MNRCKYLVLLILTFFVTAIYLAGRINTELIKLPLLTFTFTMLIYAIYLLLPSSDSKSLQTNSQVFDSIIFLLITAVAYSVFIYPQTQYFPIISSFTSIVLAARILFSSPRLALNIIQIALVSIITRAGYFFAAPSYGPDRFHRALPGYIMEVGHLIPENVIYYRFYPLAHIIGATGGLLTSLSPTRAMFIFVTGGQVLAFLGVFLITRHFVVDDRFSLLAMLVVANSAGPLLRGSQIFAQTYAVALIPLLVWLTIKDQTTRLLPITILLYFAAFLGHHSIGFTLPLILVSLFIADRLLRVFPKIDIYNNFDSLYRAIPSLGILLGIFATYYWISIGQIRGQVVRVMAIISLDVATAESAVSETAGFQPPTTVFFDVSIPPILAWASPLLAISVLVGISFLLGSTHLLTNKGSFDYSYVFAASIFFGGFTIAFAIGSQTAVMRILPAVTIFTTPLIAFIAQELNRKWGGKVIIVMLCSLVFVSAIISPAVAIPDRSENDFQPMQTSEDIAASNWAKTHGETIVADSDVRAYLYWEDISNGKIPQWSQYQSVLSRKNADETNEYKEYWQSKSNASIFIWQSYYYRFYLISPPQNVNQIYDNGSNKIYRKVHI